MRRQRTEWAVHDLLRVSSAAELLADEPPPPWAYEALRRAPWVVVRRARAGDGRIAIGVRGAAREQRFAGFLDASRARSRDAITPEVLAELRRWRASPRLHEIAALAALDDVAQIMAQAKDGAELPWGPTGSVGFELASGVATATETSDLDLVIRAARPIAGARACALMAELVRLRVRVDVQIETPRGAIALSELARGSGTIMLRTELGPRIVTDPWSSPDHA